MAFSGITKFISQLTATKSISDTDNLIVGNTDAKKITWAQIIALIKTKLNIGNTSLDGIGDGTLTGAITELNSNLKKNYVQGGVETTRNLNGYFRSVHVVYPIKYKTVPNIAATVVNNRNTAADARLTTLIKNVSNTGADVFVGDPEGAIDTYNYQVQWIAVGEIK